MSGANYYPEDLPTYIKNGDFIQQEGYFELLSLILTKWLNSNGWLLPTLTDAQVTALLALSVPPEKGTIWFNTTKNKLQFVDNSGATQIVTST